VDGMTMKIDGPGRGNAIGRTRRAGRTGGGANADFERALNGFLGDGPGPVGGADGASASHGAAPVDSLQGLLSVQEVGADDDASSRQRRERMMRRGEDMLDRLEEVRLGLLLGAIPKDRLMELARTVRARREQGPDRQLDALLDEIELRAEVELAKLSRAEA